MQLLPGRHAVQTALIKRLQKDQERARLRDLLGFNQLIAGADLTGGDVVLHPRYDHRNDGQGFGGTGCFGGHADLDHLRFKLPEAGLKRMSSASGWDQDTGRSHERIDDVADPKNELLHPAGHAGINNRFVQIDLRCLSAASALAFWAGRRVEMRVSAACLAASAATTPPLRPSTKF